MSFSSRRFAVLAFVCATSACGIGPDAEVSASLTSETVRPNVHLVVIIGTTVLVAQASQYTLEVRRPKKQGEYPATVILRGVREQDVLVKLPFSVEDASVNWISGHIGMRRPEGFCMGTLRASIPLEPAMRDTLWVNTGSLTYGAVC